jgi:hypothetical protein
LGKSAIGGAQVQLVEGVVLSGGRLEEARLAPRNTAGLISQAGQLLFHIGAVACRPLPVSNGGERAEPTGAQLVRIQLRPERPAEYWGLSPASVMDIFWQLLRDLEGGDLSDSQAQRAFEKFVETWFKFFNAGHTMESALDQARREVGRTFKSVHNQHFVVVQSFEKREKAEGTDPKKVSVEQTSEKGRGKRKPESQQAESKKKTGAETPPKQSTLSESDFCRRWNWSEAGCSNRNCKFVHRCQRCNSRSHAAAKCPLSDI